MAQSNFEERIDTYEIESTNVMTGDRDRSRYLYYQLKMSMATYPALINYLNRSYPQKLLFSHTPIIIIKGDFFNILIFYHFPLSIICKFLTL